jgi:hypothetical protein
MKRRQRETPNKASPKARAIDPDRLTHVRGGSDLGIAAVKIGPTPFEMSIQHNEALVRLRL